jgi:hypothetical protein
LIVEALVRTLKEQRGNITTTALRGFGQPCEEFHFKKFGMKLSKFHVPSEDSQG